MCFHYSANAFFNFMFTSIFTAILEMVGGGLESGIKGILFGILLSCNFSDLVNVRFPFLPASAKILIRAKVKEISFQRECVRKLLELFCWGLLSHRRKILQ